MRLQPVDSLLLTRTSLIEYFLFGVRLVHGVTCILPGLVILIIWQQNSTATHDSYYAVQLFFAIVGVLIFQAFGVYSETLFSNALRFRIICFHGPRPFASCCSCTKPCRCSITSPTMN